MSGLEPVSRAELGPERWDALADGSDEAWLWQLDAYCEAYATWRDATDHSFALVDGHGTAVLTMPLHAFAYARLRGRLPFTRFSSVGGPATAPDLSSKQALEARRQATEHAAAIASAHGGVEVDVVLAPLAPAYRGDRCPRINPLLELGYENTLTQTWVVDLSGGTDAVWDGMRQRGRRMVRRAEKAGIAVRVADRPGDLDTYYDLHRRTYERTGAVSHPRAYFEHIFERFLPAGRAYILFAELDGDVVAARNYSVYKDAALYWTGAAAGAGLDSNASALLQWRAMEWMVEQGLRWAENGETLIGTDDTKAAGLGHFKGSFGGELYPLFRGRQPIERRSHEVLDALGRLRRLVRPSG